MEAPPPYAWGLTMMDKPQGFRKEVSAVFDCLCMGIVVADHLCEPIDHLPSAGELVLTPRTHLMPGGCAANVAVDLARLGRKAAVVGCVGDDAFGRFLSDALRESGVEVEYLRRCAGEATSCSMIVNVKEQDRRFIHARGANSRLTGKEIDEQLLRHARAVYVGGYCLSDQPTPENVTHLFRTARGLGVTTVLDVVIPQEGNYWHRLARVLPWTDVFLPNDDEGIVITGESDPLTQARVFRDAGAGAAVITCGMRGSAIACNSGTYRCGSYAVEFVDGTGSGDAFTAGFLHGLLQGLDVLHCVQLGSALGASCVQAIGATAGVFDSQQLATFVAAHSLEITPSQERRTL